MPPPVTPQSEGLTPSAHTQAPRFWAAQIEPLRKVRSLAGHPNLIWHIHGRAPAHWWDVSSIWGRTITPKLGRNRSLKRRRGYGDAIDHTKITPRFFRGHWWLSVQLPQHQLNSTCKCRYLIIFMVLTFASVHHSVQNKVCWTVFSCFCPQFDGRALPVFGHLYARIAP